jgi:hypothetical protein
VRRFVTLNALTLSPAWLRKAGGGLRISARQAQLAKRSVEASFDVIGLHERRLPAAQISTCGHYTCVYSAVAKGCNGCGFWIRTALALHRKHCRAASGPISAGSGRAGTAFFHERVLCCTPLSKALNPVQLGGMNLPEFFSVCLVMDGLSSLLMQMGGLALAAVRQLVMFSLTLKRLMGIFFPSMAACSGSGVQHFSD